MTYKHALTVWNRHILWPPCHPCHLLYLARRWPYSFFLPSLNLGYDERMSLNPLDWFYSSPIISGYVLGSWWLTTTALGVVDGFGIGLCAWYEPSEISSEIKGSYFLLRSHRGSCFSGLRNYTPMTESEHLLWLRYWWWRRLSFKPAPHKMRYLAQ